MYPWIWCTALHSYASISQCKGCALRRVSWKMYLSCIYVLSSAAFHLKTTYRYSGILVWKWRHSFIFSNAFNSIKHTKATWVEAWLALFPPFVSPECFHKEADPNLAAQLQVSQSSDRTSRCASVHEPRDHFILIRPRSHTFTLAIRAGFSHSSNLSRGEK